MVTRRVDAYVSGVALVGLVLLASALWVVVRAPWSWEVALRAAAAAVVLLLLHRYPFTLHWRQHRIVVSLDEAGILVALLLLPPSVVVACVLVSTVLVQVWGGPSETIKRVFNVAQNVAAAAITAATFAALATLGVPTLLAACVSAALFGTVANILLAGVFAVLDGVPVLRVYRERFLAQGLNSGLIGIAGGLTVVALWDIHPLATLSIVPFAYLVRRYWKLHAAADRELDVHRRLANATHELVGTASVPAVAERVLAECERLLDCGHVELTLRLGTSPDDAIIFERSFGSGPKRHMDPLSETLPSRAGATLGALAVWPRQGKDDFGEQERELVRTIAAQASAAIENARAIAEADAARERLQTYLATAQDAVLLVDTQGGVQYMNPAARRLFGVRPEEPLACFAWDLFEDPRLAVVPTEPVLVEAGARDVAGTRAFTVEAHAGPVVERGRTTGMLMVVRDITERRRLEDEMARQRDVMMQQEKLSTLGTLVAGVAHEVNNPLTFMRGNLQLCRSSIEERLRRADLTPEERRFAEDIDEEVRVALDGVERIAQIASSLKSVARRGTTEHRPEDLNQIVTEVVSVVRVGIPRAVHVELDLQPDLPPVLVRASEIHQVLLNIVKNAAESLEGREEPRVRVRSFVHQGQVRVDVEDNGCGIPPEVQKQLFTAFFTTKAKGTGLGLSISRGIIQRHGGMLSLRSTVGVGTTFTIELPPASTDAGVEAVSPPA